MEADWHIDRLREEYERGERGDAWQALNEAQVVMGQCTVTGNEFLAFGRGHLRRVVEKGQTEELVTLRIALDQTEQSDDLEFLLAALQTLRGHDDYEA